jgi:hypothetical protein
MFDESLYLVSLLVPGDGFFPEKAIVVSVAILRLQQLEIMNEVMDIISHPRQRTKKRKCIHNNFQFTPDPSLERSGIHFCPWREPPIHDA